MRFAVKWIRWFFILGVCLVLSSCTTKEPLTEIPKLENAEVTLKIAVPDDNFSKSFRSILEKKYPKLTLEFIQEDYFKNVESGEWNEWLETHKPDLIVSFDRVMFSKLVKDGLLFPLDPYIKRDNVDLGLYVSSVIEWLRLQDENRQLYGLAREFEPVILMYNTEHFDRLGIPYPSEKMTWSELLQLAQRFQDDPVYGLQVYTPTPSRMIAEIGRTEELRLYDMDTGEVFANTEEWKSIWKQVLQGYKTGEIKFGGNLFPEDAAMVLQYVSNPRVGLSATWKLAYFPINAENPDESHALFIHRPISIYNQSQYKEYAWELLKYLTSEDMFRYIGDSMFGLPNIMNMVANYSIDNAHVLYNFHPKVDTIPEFPNMEVLREFYDMGDRIFENMSQGTMTLDEGLEQYEQELKDLLKKAREREENSE